MKAFREKVGKHVGDGQLNKSVSHPDIQNGKKFVNNDKVTATLIVVTDGEDGNAIRGNPKAEELIRRN